MNSAERTAVDILDAGDDVRLAYALPAVRPGKCSVCHGRMWGSDIARGTCTTCVENPISAADVRALEIPGKYRWARLEQPIIPPAWDKPHPLISDRHRLRALSWANGELDGPKNAITITAERNGESVTGAGKSSLAAAIARHVAERLGLSITWVLASDLRGDHDDPRVPRDALRRLLRADLSVLDGVGKELGGAQDVKGWQPARTPLLMEYAARMYENDRGIRITTLDLPGQALAGIYGADLVRRFGRRDKLTGREENATLITL